MNQKVMMKIMQWMLVAVVSLIIGGSAGLVTTVHAAENADIAVTQEQPVAGADTASGTDEANTAASGFFLLAGGMLILILAVVITVVSTFVSSAAIVDEL